MRLYPAVKTVLELPAEAQFVTDSQEIAAIAERIPAASEYDALFIVIRDGEYVAVWGMYGLTPYDSRALYRLNC